MGRRAITTLVLAAVVSPVGFLTANMSRSPSLVRIASLAAILLLVPLSLEWTLAKRGASEERSVPAIAAGVVTFSYVGLLQSRLDLSPLASTMLGLLITTAVVLAVVMATRRWRYVDFIILSGLAAAVASPMLLAILNQPASAQTYGSDDVVVIFLDGYASSEALWAIYGLDNSRFESALIEKGFEVVPNAVASYSMTYASIASVLEMDYVVDTGYVPDSILRPDLYSRMKGDNAFTRTARDLGFEYIHFESGWGGTQCGHVVDRCIRAPFIEETVWNFMQRTALAPMMQVWFGHSFPANGLDRLAALADLELDGTKPELVIGHVLIPHPPLLVDDRCQVNYAEGLDGMNVGAPYFSELTLSRRRQAYVTQLKCTNRKVLEVLDNPSLTNAVVVILGDHGTDAQGQLVTPVSAWTEEMIKERMTTLAAVRGCDGDAPTETINILRWVSNCALGQNLPMLELRRFLVPVTENHPGDGVIEVPTR